MASNRFALWLSLFTVAYNVAEGIVSVWFARADDSTALLGFGADSFFESLSGLIMVWRFWNPGDKARDGRAARLIGGSFIVLACYVAYEAIGNLAGTDENTSSLAALIIAALSLAVMPTLFLLKRRTAQRLESRGLLADAKQTLACLMMSVALLVGAGLNYWAGIWYADPLAGLLIALYLVREGWDAINKSERL